PAAPGSDVKATGMSRYSYEKTLICRMPCNAARCQVLSLIVFAFRLHIPRVQQRMGAYCFPTLPQEAGGRCVSCLELLAWSGAPRPACLISRLQILQSSWPARAVICT